MANSNARGTFLWWNCKKTFPIIALHYLSLFLWPHSALVLLADSRDLFSRPSNCRRNCLAHSGASPGWYILVSSFGVLTFSRCSGKRATKIKTRGERKKETEISCESTSSRKTKFRSEARRVAREGEELSKWICLPASRSLDLSSPLWCMPLAGRVFSRSTYIHSRTTCTYINTALYSLCRIAPRVARTRATVERTSERKVSQWSEVSKRAERRMKIRPTAKRSARSSPRESWSQDHLKRINCLLTKRLGTNFRNGLTWRYLSLFHFSVRRLCGLQSSLMLLSSLMQL